MFSLFTKIPPQYLPHHALSRFGGLIATLKIPCIKNWIINDFIARYNVNMQEAQFEHAADYVHFQDFFARHLKVGMRSIDPNPAHITSPVDGCISEVGKITHDRLLQAKGREYTLAALLGESVPQQDEKFTQTFIDGEFMTIYLAPPDYHRVHTPIAGKLIATRYVPGRLFSVNPCSVNKVDALFARNERLICIFETAVGKVAVILVGAMLVASIHTVWQGLVTPPHQKKMISNIFSQPLSFEKGQEIGHFNLGSTVILLFEKNSLAWKEDMQAKRVLRLGEKIAFSRHP